jgi:flagellar hook-length control protein FliK
MPAQAIPNATPSVAQPTATTAPRTPPPLPNLSAAAQVAVQIGDAATAGLGYIRIQLQPAELGRVDVKLSLDHNGQVMAAISADRHDTLALLQHDAPALQHALQQAGLKADSGSLNFSLNRQNTGSGGGGSGDTTPRFIAPSGGSEPAPMPVGILPANFGSRTSGLDIRV